MAQEEMPDPAFPTDSLAIEQQSAPIIFQKKASKSRSYCRKQEKMNALVLKRLKQQEACMLPNLRTDSLKYQQYPAIKSPDRDSLMRQSKDTVFINKLKNAARSGRSADTLQSLQNLMGKFSDRPLGNVFNLPELQQKATF